MKNTKEILIKEIWNHCKNTHNNQDYKDLQEFNLKELKEILKNINEEY